MIFGARTEGRKAVPDRETIESTLHRVQTGELSPAAATKLLLAGEETGLSTSNLQYESLASLVQRLGTPPTDIVETWCRQLQDIASQHEDQTGEGLPAIDQHLWSITPSGQLIWQGQSQDTSRVMPRPSGTSLDRIEEFRATFIPTEPLIPEVSGCSDTIASVVTHEDQTFAMEQPRRRVIGPHARRALFIAGVLTCVWIAGWILYDATRTDVETIANIDTPAMPAVEAGPTTAAATTGHPSDTSVPVAVETLETLDSLNEAELSSPEAVSVELKPSFSLDELMPPAASFVPDPNSRDGTTTSSADDQGPMAADSADSLEQTLGDDAAPAESPQQTRTSKVRAVALHSMDDTGEPTILPAINLTQLKLGFPFDVPLEIGGDESNWEIRDSRKNTPVAVITKGADGPGLKWSERAKESPNAAALVHGRITDRDGVSFFLRPVIEADPWPIRVDKPDVKPMWDLRYPIPPRAARISVDFDIPDEIEEGWIEPIESESLRRARGLAVLTPKDGETVSLGVRFDIRCSRKLTCRVRYAGRLDPSMPWQVVSVSMLEQFANQLAQQAVLVSTEASRLAAVYDVAGTSERRILRVKRDRNDAHGEMISTASQRVAELQTLIAGLEAEGLLKIRVWVEWPNEQQTLLTMHHKDGPQSDRRK